MGPSAAVLRARVGKSEAIDDAMARFGLAYAEQNERDFEALGTAARQRRIKLTGGRGERATAAF